MSTRRDAVVSEEAQERFEALSREELRNVAPDTGFWSGAAASIRDIVNHRHLWALLTKRELKARYKDSFFGYLWTLVRPLVNLFIYYMVIGNILGARASIPDFAIYVFAGLTSWGLFSQIVASSTASIIANSGIVKKVYLPREIFPLSASGAAFVDFLSQMVILIVAGLTIGGGINPVRALIYFPISLVVIVVWGLAAGLFLAAANVYLRDVQYLVEVALMIGFWATPSVYAFSMIVNIAPTWAANLYVANPTALAVLGFQEAFWTPDTALLMPSHLLTRLAICAVVGLILLFLAQRLFARLQRNFAQEL